LIKERVSEHARLGGETLGGMMSVVGKGEENQEIYGGASGSDKIKMLGDAVAPMVSQLEKLGPDGLLVSAVVEGSFVMGEALLPSQKTYSKYSNYSRRLSSRSSRNGYFG